MGVRLDHDLAREGTVASSLGIAGVLRLPTLRSSPACRSNRHLQCESWLPWMPPPSNVCLSLIGSPRPSTSVWNRSKAGRLDAAHPSRMNQERARNLVAAERARIEAALSDLTVDVRGESVLESQQTGEASEVGSDLQTEGVEMALISSLRERLASVARAEARLAAGTYGRSIESGALIPDDRLEVAPLVERTVEEQRAVESRRA